MAGQKTRVETEWNGDAVFQKLNRTERKYTKRLVLATEAQAKDNIAKPFVHKQPGRKSKELNRGQIDIGTMVNSTQAITNPAKLPGRIIAAVVVGVYYAIYQEFIRAFLLPAAEQAAKDFPEMVRRAKAESGVD